MSGMSLFEGGLAILFLVQGVFLVFWPDRALAWQYWKLTRVIGAKPAPPGPIDRAFQRFTGLGSLVIAAIILISLFRA
jgi:hypothetical protein